jgi:PhzF family phenazine biosynthesis protein
MRLRQYQVDAFANRVFEGNPAAVCPLEQWPEDTVLQAIAEENQLSETAFFGPEGRGFRLRWFTPLAEVDLCGHATLASAHVLFEILGHPEPSIRFATRSGELTVERRGDRLAMDFPARPPAPCAAPPALLGALGAEPLEVLAADDYIAVFGSESAVRALEPDMAKLRGLELRGVCVTARGRDVDFVSRFFAPRVGVPEDPVTGSAHCELAPYWAARLGRNSLRARQVSRRGGEVGCELNGARVTLLGRAVTFMEGEIRIDH